MNPKVCVIGAGPSGIAAAKNCIEAGIPVVVFEKSDKVGGNWVFDDATGHSSVYENTHIISSRAWSAYEDFPMPLGTPDYPHHRILRAYFDSYASHFGVIPHIRFQHTVDRAALDGQGGWRVEFTDAEGRKHSEQYSHLMVANGHHWHPNWPKYNGVFSGTFMHSHDFKRADDSWRGKKVLIIGAGNSACDVAVELARLAGKVAMSMRSPQWFIPKYVFGVPVDRLSAGNFFFPTRLGRHALGVLLRLLQGHYRDIGLPENTRPPLFQHPTLNSDVLDFIRHRRIFPRTGIERLDGSAVVFTDGRREDFDVIVACTGFRIAFPFFDRAFIDYSEAERVPLWRKMMHADHRTLYFIGLFQPQGCIWPMADMQARLACAEISGKYERPADLRAAIAHEAAHPHRDFDRSARHSTEVDYQQFRDDLKRELRKAGIDIGLPPAWRKRSTRTPGRDVLPKRRPGRV